MALGARLRHQVVNVVAWVEPVNLIWVIAKGADIDHYLLTARNVDGDKFLLLIGDGAHVASPRRIIPQDQAVIRVNIQRMWQLAHEILEVRNLESTREVQGLVVVRDFIALVGAGGTLWNRCLLVILFAARMGNILFTWLKLLFMTWSVYNKRGRLSLLIFPVCVEWLEFIGSTYSKDAV